MIYWTWDYCSVPIFRHRLHFYVKTSSDSVFEAAIHKQRNAVQHISALTRMEPNFLASKSFLWLWNVSKWTILLAFGTSLQQVMPPIRNLGKFSLFHRHAGLRHRNHRSWSVETTQDASFRQEQPHRKYMNSLNIEFICIICDIRVWNCLWGNLSTTYPIWYATSDPPIM